MNSNETSNDQQTRAGQSARHAMIRSVCLYLRDDGEGKGGVRLLFLIGFIFKQFGVSLELEDQVQDVDDQQDDGSAMTEIDNASVDLGCMSSGGTESSRNQQGESSKAQKRGGSLCS